MPVLRITNKVSKSPLAKPMHYLAYGNYGTDQSDNVSSEDTDKALKNFNNPHTNNHQVTNRNYNLLSTDGIVNWNPKMPAKVGLAQLKKLNRIYDRYMSVAPAYHVKAFNMVVNFGHDFNFKASPEDRFEALSIVHTFLHQNFKDFPALLASQDDSTNKQSHVHIMLLNYNPVTHKSLSNQQRNAWRLDQSLQDIAKVHNQKYPWRKVHILHFSGKDRRTKPTIIEQSAIRHFKPVLDDIKKKHFTDFSQVRADGLKNSIIIDKHNKGDIRLNKNFDKLKNKKEAFYTRDGMSLKVPTIHSTDPNLAKDNTRGFISLSKITPFVEGASVKDIEQTLHVNSAHATVIGSATAQLQQASLAHSSVTASVNAQQKRNYNSYQASSAFASNMSGDIASNHAIDSKETSQAINRVKLVYKAMHHNHEMHVSHQDVDLMIKPLQRSSAINKIKQAKAKRLANLAMNRLIIKRAINQLHNNVQAGKQYQAHHDQFVTVKNSLVNKEITNSLKPISPFGSSAKTLRAKRNSLISESVATSQAEDMGMKLVPKSLASENFDNHVSAFKAIRKSDVARLHHEKFVRTQRQMDRDLAQMHQLNVKRRRIANEKASQKSASEEARTSKASISASMKSDLLSRIALVDSETSATSSENSSENPMINRAANMIKAQSSANHLTKHEEQTIQASLAKSQASEAKSVISSSVSNAKSLSAKVSLSNSQSQSASLSASTSASISASASKAQSAKSVAPAGWSETVAKDEKAESESAFRSKMSHMIYSAGDKAGSEALATGIFYNHSNSAEVMSVYNSGFSSGFKTAISSLAKDNGGVKAVAPNYYTSSVNSAKSSESAFNSYINHPEDQWGYQENLNNEEDKLRAIIRRKRQNRGFDR